MFGCRRVHLSNADGRRCPENVSRSGSTYLAATTFTARSRNEDIVRGAWRPLNLCLEPFGLPAPLRLLDEQCMQI